MKSFTLGQLLTDHQIETCIGLYATHGDAAVDHIVAEVTGPHLATINAKAGQENDARYLAYVIVYLCRQAAKGQAPQ